MTSAIRIAVAAALSFTSITLAHAQQQKKDAQAFIKRFEAIDTTGFSEQDRLNKQLMVQQLRDGVQATNLKLNEMPVDQFATMRDPRGNLSGIFGAL